MDQSSSRGAKKARQWSSSSEVWKAGQSNLSEVKKARATKTQWVQKWLTFPDAHGHPLLPGLPNDVTLAKIVPMLEWRDFYTLAAVSPAWCHAIRSRQVYNERVRSKSTEAHGLLCYERFCKKRRQIAPAVAVYSMKDDSWCELPLIPPVRGGVNPNVFNCLGMDGKIYLLEVQNRKFDGFLDTYVFDLAGQRHWRKCAQSTGYSMLCGYYGVMDEKIFSLWCLDKPLHGSTLNSQGIINKVYDPVEDTWSPIKPIRYLQMGNQERSTRIVDGFQALRVDEVLFLAQGELRTLTGLGISSFSLGGRQSTLLHSVSPELLELAVDTVNLHPIVAHAIGDELLAMVTPYGVEHRNRGTFIVRCKGLGSQNKELIWQRATIPRSFSTPSGPSCVSLYCILL